MRSGDYDFSHFQFQKPINIYHDNVQNETLEELLALKERIDRISLIDISEKDIVMLIGVTGSGKSTTINYLRGETFTKRQRTINNECGEFSEEVYEINSKKNDDQAQMGEINSVTTDISFFEWNFNEQTKNILLCDTPGQMDTRGQMSDIINQYAIIKNIKNANTVRVVIIIESNAFADCSRGGNLKGVLKQLAYFIDDLEILKKNMIIKFTKMKEDNYLAKISYRLNILQNDYEIMKDKKLKEFASLMVEKISKQDRDLIFIDLTNQKQLSQQIDEILKTKEIPQLLSQKCFKFSVTQEAQQKFQSLYQNNCNNFIKNINKLQISQIKRLFLLFEFFDQNLEFTQLSAIFQELINQLKVYISETIQQNQISEIRDQSKINKIIQEIIPNVCELISFMLSLKYEDLQVQANKCKEEIMNQYQQLQDKLQPITNFKLAHSIFERMKLIHNNYQISSLLKQEDKYKDNCKYFIEQWDEKISNIQTNLFGENNYDLQEDLDWLKSIYEEQILNQVDENPNVHIDKLNQIKDLVNNQFTLIQNVFDQKSFKDQDLQLAKKSYIILQSIQKQPFILNIILTKEEFQVQLKLTQKLIKTLCSKLYENIKWQEQFEKIQLLLAQFHGLSSLDSDIIEQTSDIKQDLNQHLSDKINQLIIEADKKKNDIDKQLKCTTYISSSDLQKNENEYFVFRNAVDQYQKILSNIQNISELQIQKTFPFIKKQLEEHFKSNSNFYNDVEFIINDSDSIELAVKEDIQHLKNLIKAFILLNKNKNSYSQQLKQSSPQEDAQKLLKRFSENLKDKLMAKLNRINNINFWDKKNIEKNNSIGFFFTELKYSCIQMKKEIATNFSDSKDQQQICNNFQLIQQEIENHLIDFQRELKINLHQQIILNIKDTKIDFKECKKILDQLQLIQNQKSLIQSISDSYYDENLNKVQDNVLKIEKKIEDILKQGQFDQQYQEIQNLIDVLTDSQILYDTHLGKKKGCQSRLDEFKQTVESKKVKADQQIQQLVEKFNIEEIKNTIEKDRNSEQNIKLKRCVQKKIESLVSQIKQSVENQQISTSDHKNKFELISQVNQSLEKLMPEIKEPYEQLNKFIIQQYNNYEKQLKVLIFEDNQLNLREIDIKFEQIKSLTNQFPIKFEKNQEYIKENVTKIEEKLTKYFNQKYLPINDIQNKYKEIKEFCSKNESYSNIAKSIQELLKKLLEEKMNNHVTQLNTNYQHDQSLSDLETTLKDEYEQILLDLFGNQSESQKFLENILKTIKSELDEVIKLKTSKQFNEIIQLKINSSIVLNKLKTLITQDIQYYKGEVFEKDILFRKTEEIQQLIQFISTLNQQRKNKFQNLLIEFNDYRNQILGKKLKEILSFFEKMSIETQENTVIKLTNITYHQKLSEFLNSIQFFKDINININSNNKTIQQKEISKFLKQIFSFLEKKNKDTEKCILSMKATDLLRLFTDLSLLKTNVICPDKVDRSIYPLLECLVDNLANQEKKQKYKDILNLGYWNTQNIHKVIIKQLVPQISDTIKNECKINVERVHLKIQRWNDFTKKLFSMNMNLDYQVFDDIIKNSYENICKECIDQIKLKNFNEDLNIQISRVYSLEKTFQNIFQKNKIPFKYQEIVDQIKDVITGEVKQASIDQEDSFVTKLIFIRQIADKVENIHSFSLQQLNEVIKRSFEDLSMAKIQKFVEDICNKDPIGKIIIQENKNIFANILSNQINKATENFNSIDYLMDNLDNPKYNKEEFKLIYEDFGFNYKEFLEKWQISELSTERILEDTKKYFLQFKQKYGAHYLKINNNQNIEWSKDQKKELIKLVSYITAFWCVYQTGKDNNKYKTLHIVQIAALLCLLSIDNFNKSVLENHLVEVKTGEGKSIILGLVSSILALLGFNVDCCCYSQYLSQRDYDDFLPFFIVIGVKDQIKYYTFEKLFEVIINNSRDLRQIGLDYIQKNYSKQQNKERKKDNYFDQRILLIDEVDFFLSEEFYNKYYSIACELKNKEIEKAIKFIWQNKYLNFKQFKKTSQYQNVFNLHPSLNLLKDFLDTRFEKMLNDAHKLENNEYELFIPTDFSEDPQIIYRKHQSIQSNSHKGYYTQYAYIQEWEKQNITETVMDKNLSMIINLGMYSYEEIPKSYKLILGVSGTLKDMSIQKKQFTEKTFNIKQITILPSKYGKQNLTYDEKKDIHILQNQYGFHEKIKEQIQSILDQKRAIIIFFKDNKQLFQFKQYLLESGFVGQIQVLTEESNHNFIIPKVGTPRFITLSTQSFGRGCDYKSPYKEVNDAGGIHVIQAFFTHDLSLMTQIKGRTARESLNGSYSLVINLQDLKVDFETNEEQFKAYSSLQSTYLKDIRIKKEEEENKKIFKKNKQLNIEDEHVSSLKLKQFLLDYKQDQAKEIEKLLTKLNKRADEQFNVTRQYDFYSEYAGKVGFNIEKGVFDEHQNYANISLGIEGKFNGQSLLIGNFHVQCAREDMNTYLLKNVIPALKKFGDFTYHISRNEIDFCENLENYDQAWIISNNRLINSNYRDNFINSIKDHLEKQKGLMIWADNEPYCVHANLILQNISVGKENRNNINIRLKGNYFGSRVLKSGQFNQTQEFGPHYITTGLNYLYEGITIPHPAVISQTQPNNFGDLQIVALNSIGKPSIMVLQGTSERGRIVIDCAWTKLFPKYWNKEGTAKYIQNCYCWLFWKERFEDKTYNNSNYQMES